MKKPAQPDPLATLIELTGRLSAVTLESVDAEIAEAEAKVAVLCQVRSIVEVYQGKDEAGPAAISGARNVIGRRQPRGGTLPGSPRRLAVLRWLAAKGPAFPIDTIKATGTPSGSMGFVMKHEWFENTQQGWTLTESGKKAARDTEGG